MIGLTGAVAPGPLLALVLSETLRSGILACLLIVTGHSLLELLAVGGLALGLGTVLDRPMISIFIGGAGGSVMLFFAYLMISDATRGTAAPAFRTDATSARSPLGAARMFGYLGLGALISLSNPYWTIWWTTIGATLMNAARPGGEGMPYVFYLGHILADYAWYLLVAGLILSGNRILRNRTYRFLLAGCGLCLVVFGAYFLLNSLKQMLS